MKLRSSVPPFVRTDTAVKNMLGTAIFALLSLLVLPAVRYGFRPLVLAGAAVLTCFLCEFFCGLIRTGSNTVTEPSFAVTGLIIAVLLPVNAPLWLACAAGAFAVLVAKVPFGSFGRTPFNPAAAGIAFTALCWPKLMFTYLNPADTGRLPVFADFAFQAAESPAAVLKSGLKPDVLPMNMLWGDTVGPMGTTAILVIGACAVLLFVRRAAHWETTFCFLAAAAILAAFFPRIACSPLTSIKYELLSGSLFFCSVFMVTDPVTSPRTAPARCLYGAFAGAAVMAFRYFGAYEQGAAFAVLLANAFAPLMENAVCRAKGWEAKPHE